MEYCPLCPDNSGANLAVTSHGINPGGNRSIHHHDDPVADPPVTCVMVEVSGETQPAKSNPYPHAAGDQSSIADGNAWMAYLQANYVP